jgi:hypothetical protein
LKIFAIVHGSSWESEHCGSGLEEGTYAAEGAAFDSHFEHGKRLKIVGL